MTCSRRRRFSTRTPLGTCDDPYALEFDMGPFNAHFPSMSRPSSIGEGVSYLNRLLSSRLMVQSAGQDNMQLLFEFLRMHRRDGVPLMINEDVMADLPTMARALARAIRFLDSFPPEVPGCVIL